MRQLSEIIAKEFGSSLVLTKRVQARLAKFDKTRIRFTKHALARAQQRGINDVQCALILTFGTFSQAGKGARSYYFDRSSRKRLHQVLGPQHAQFAEKSNIFLIVSQDHTQIVTCSHRTKRRRR